MGTRSNLRHRRRATKRGLASFVSFFLLFAFALGQSSLSALADDASTDPVAAEEVVSDGSRVDATLPVAEEEAPAEESPADVPDAPDPAASDDAMDDSDGSSGGQAAAAAPTTRRASKPEAAPVNRDAIIQSHGGLHGGDVSLDYIAAGPFTYNHATGLGTFPTFGYNDRTIDPNDGVVESLESGDFACGDHVTFFTQISIEEGADGPGTVQLHQTWGMEPTGQPGLGFNNIVSVAINTPDDGNVGNVADNVVTLDQEFTETVGYNQLHGLISITNLAPGETAILRSIVILACGAGSPTGNILNDIQSATADGDNVSVGQQTVPMKVTGFVGAPAIDITKACPASVPFGQPVVFQFTLVNDGNEPLTNVVVNDPLLGGNINAQFTPALPNPLPVGTTVYTASIPYTPGANEDPVQNAVTVTAAGSISAIAVADGAACDTDITHVPGIDVTKSCPASVPFGQAITYTITVRNTGNEPLEGVTVDDTLLGTISAATFNPDLPDPMPVGNTVYTATVSRTPVAGDPDPLTNTVTATGTGADSGVEASDEASCTTDITHVPNIDVTKSCPASVPFGQAITYTITVQNTGNEPLVGVTVNDSLLGPISATAFNPDLPGTLPVGNTVYTATVSRMPVAGDPDPLTNTVTASGTGADSGVVDTDSASCTTDITHVPNIDVTKSCPAEVPFGQAITYTITVQNTGNEPLVGVTVNDSLLGPISAATFNPDLPGTLPVGNTFYTATVSRTPVAGDPDPLTNTVTASGTGADSGVVDTDTASCTTDITHEPNIDVTKSCPESVPFGEDIEYTITVENTGNEALEGVSVTDTLLGDITGEFDFDFSNPFPVGGFATAVVTYSPGADEDPVLNTVTATGIGADSGVEASDEASCETDITHEPGIDVTKSCPESVPFGEDIEYTITVENTGNEALEGVSVTDTLLGDITGEFDFDFSNPFPVGGFATAVVTYSPGADEDPVLNTVTATGIGADSGVEASDEASCETDITHEPGIDVTKSCPESAGVGDVITYEITITNTGNEALENITVNDSILGNVSDEFPDTLGAGDSFTAFIDYTVTEQSPDPIHNVVTASGLGADSEVEATDEASCDTDVEHPAIQIVKDGPALVHRGDTITYLFEVTNIGDVDLFDVELTDPICDEGTIALVDDGDGDSMLAIGEVWHFTCTHLVTDDDPDPIPNTGTVTGDTDEGEGGDEVTDTDDHVVDIIHPGIEIVKTVDEETVPIGTTVTYTYVITNTGDTTLYDISVDDDILGHIGDIEVLEPGQSVTLTKDFVVGDEPVTNVGTAEGEDILGRSVSSLDDATVTPIADVPPEEPPTPFTGSDAGRLGIISMVLFGIGVTVVATTRRRRPEREAA